MRDGYSHLNFVDLSVKKHPQKPSNSSDFLGAILVNILI